MNIAKIYDQLKTFDSELPSMVNALMGSCKQSYCGCRREIDEARLVSYYENKRDETQKSYDDSIKALMNNPNILLVSQAGAYLEDDLLPVKDQLSVLRIDVIEVE